MNGTEESMRNRDDRLTRLEVSNRRLRLAVAGLGIVIGTLVCGAMGSPPFARGAAPEVTTPRLSITDAKGRARIVLSVDDELGPAVCLKDAQGGDRVAVGFSDKHKTCFVQMGETGPNPLSVALTCVDGDAGGLTIRHGDQQRATFVYGNGVASLSFSDENGRARLQGATDSEGGSFLRMNDERGRPEVTLSFLDKLRILAIGDATGASAVVSVDGEKPRISVRDKNGKVSALP